MKGLILAGGLGKRLRPLSHTGPKQLVPVANKPVLFYGIEDLKEAGIEEIGIIVGYTKERINKIKEACGDGSKWGIKITYIEQDAPRGLAHAVLIAKDFLGDDNFVVYLGDNILKEGIKKFVEEFRNSKCDASILLTEVEHPEMYGTAILNGSGEVMNVEEKPKEPKSNLAIVGVYLFTPAVFEAIKKVKPTEEKEWELTDAISVLIKSKEHKVGSHIVSGWWDDTGTAEAMLHANHLVLMDLKSENKGEIEKNVKLVGNIKIGAGTVVEEGTVIKGPVIIGENCKIGPNTYIGPYTSIGDNCEVIGSEIEYSIILDNTKIQIGGKIVESLIGKHVKITSKKSIPKGHKLILGENSEVVL